MSWLSHEASWKLKCGENLTRILSFPHRTGDPPFPESTEEMQWPYNPVKPGPFSL